VKNIVLIVLGVLLLAACGQSYEETKRLTTQQRREAAKKDSAALKVAVMPTLDCLPLFVAQHYNLYDTLRGGVRLKLYKAQMDCDTALERGRVEGMVTDLVRAVRIAKKGTKMRYVAATNAYWQLVSNRNSRVKQVKQLDDKMIAMTRYSVTDMLADAAIDSAKLDKDHVFKVQVNDVFVRVQMLQNNIMDVLCLTEPQATWARTMKNPVVLDTRDLGWQMGVIAFREKEMLRQARGKQLELFVKAYNQACDSINKYGVAHYREIINSRFKLKAELVDSLPKDLKFAHAKGPRQEDMERAEKWLTNGNNR
jgi:NitT/TauT family transport system substrate-binding protein